MSKMKKIKFLSDIEVTGTMTVGESKAEILTKDDLATPDWNQNDENASDYVKNRTHYEEPAINKEYVILDKSYSFEEEQQEGYGGTGYFKYPLVKDWSEIITIGSKLTVTIDGEIHEAIFEDYYHGFELPGLLAGTGYDDPDNYPTLYFDADGITLHFGYNAGGWSMDIGPLTISTNKEAVVHHLDEKFIPDTIARTQTVDEKISQSFTSYKPTELIRTSNDSDHCNHVVYYKGHPEWAPTVAGKIYYSLRNYQEYFPFWDNHNVGSTFLLEIIKDSNIIFSEKLIWHKEVHFEHSDESVLGNFALTSYSDLGDTGESAAIYINDAESYIHLYLDEGLLEIDDEVTVKLYYCNEIVNTIDDITVNTIQLNNILSNIDTHKYGDYIIAFEPSCTSKGKRYQVCSCCGNKRIEYIPSPGHVEVVIDNVPPTVESPGTTGGSICVECNTKLSEPKIVSNAGVWSNGASYFIPWEYFITNNYIKIENGVASIDHTPDGSENIVQQLYEGDFDHDYNYTFVFPSDGTVTEIKNFDKLDDFYTAKDEWGNETSYYGWFGATCIRIPRPITKIHDCAFQEITPEAGLKSIYLPSSLKEIGQYAFAVCAITDVYYDGTIAEWNQISLGEEWLSDYEEWSIHCSNGSLPKDVLFNREPGLYQTGTNTRLKTIDEMLSEDSDLTYSNGYFGSWRLSSGLEPHTGFVGDLVLPKDTTHLYNADFGQGGLATYAYITSIVIPNTCKDIGSNTFHSTAISKIIYEGTIAQWNSIITPESFGYMDTEEIKVYCLDGILTIKPTEEV